MGVPEWLPRPTGIIPVRGAPSPIMTTAARNRRPGQHPLSPRTRFGVRLIVLAPILTFFVASVLQLVKLARLVNGDLGNIVASVLHETLNHEFKIGTIHYFKAGILSIDDIAVSSKHTWKESHGEAGLSVRQVVIKYDFNSLISDPSSAGHYIQTITLDHPTTGRYLTIWLTSLPVVADGFKGGIVDVVVSA